MWSPSRSPEPTWPPPQCVSGRLNGKRANAPQHPSRAPGLEGDELRALFGENHQSDWWGAAFEMGRAPFDSKFCTVWHALFELFFPIERGLAPAYRHLIRPRASGLHEFRNCRVDVELGCICDRIGRPSALVCG